MSLEWPLESLSDDELVRGLVAALSESRRSEADLVARIAEVEVRRLYAREASPSMFVYCTNVLHLSEAEAYLRITVARAARKHPVLLPMLADGRLHLSAIARLAPHLTHENRGAVLGRAVHKTRRDIDELVAELAPRPDAPEVIRKLPGRPVLPPSAPRETAPAPSTMGELRLDGVPDRARTRAETAPPAVTAQRALIQPLSPSRYKVQFTAGPELCADLERLRALMRSQVPDGDLAVIVGQAIREKVQRLEARRFAQTRTPREAPAARVVSSSRHVPAAVRRVVYRRDQGQCRFVDAHGLRCPERHRLEYHHRHPYGFGGGHDADNICLMCRTHNALMAEVDYGRKAMSRYAGSGGESKESGRRDCVT